MGLLYFKASFSAEEKSWLHKGIVEVGVVQNQIAKVADKGEIMFQEKGEVFRGERLCGERSRGLEL